MEAKGKDLKVPLQWDLKIKNFKKIVNGDEIGLMEAVKNQPVSAAIYITDELKEYKEGIYEGPPCDSKVERKGTYAILVVGYGSDEETKKNFWWIMNSWGVSWGINGFAKVVRNSSLPKGSALVLFRASYPILF
ncbi:probable cysteine protease RDL6 [Camellia sinensis]|uniref:probable cysteine protease RDL6 n=1 Tax=Camellia sinensis TaxID=4442 RepID=UPI00103599FD|nr:probable cysteine protease RDL6 [Camellia sinensis]